MIRAIDMDRQMVDISEPEAVQIQIRADGKVIWINVDGICRFRACRIKELEITDEREG